MARDRMTDEQRAQAKGQAKNATEVHKLALKANGYGSDGYGTTRVEKERAQRALTEKLGKKGARDEMKKAAKSARSGW